jgi:hypothetical protein
MEYCELLNKLYWVLSVILLRPFSESGFHLGYEFHIAPSCIALFFVVLGLELRSFTWATPPALFLWRIFQDRGLQPLCPGWLRTVILLISASWVARTGVSHWHLASCVSYQRWFLNLSWLRLSMGEALGSHPQHQTLSLSLSLSLCVSFS